jgi:5-(carboxyamino)imidazole ribonucleotide synthase
MSQGKPLNGSKPRLGIIGGGQLARMTALAAAPLDVTVIALERTADCPAAAVATECLTGDWNSLGSLRELAARVDVVTLESEFVDAGLLAQLEQDGKCVLPSSKTMTLVQDKFIQKQTLAKAGLPVPSMRAVASIAELEAATRDLGLPLVLKARRNGYDGKGNFTVRKADDIPEAWRQLGGDKGNPLFVEAFCPFESELAIIITRGRDGSSVAYPVVETIQRNHICHLVRAPAPVPAAITERAAALAERAVAAVEAVGSFGVEMFLTANGDLFINELAPRVHNSGHYTIEGCVCSQFENHVRAVLGWPLGSTRMVAPAAVMVNLLGQAAGPGNPQGLERALAIPNAHVHAYGKAQSVAGRKMGHVTVLGNSVAEAEATALQCAGEIRFGNLP